MKKLVLFIGLVALGYGLAFLLPPSEIDAFRNVQEVADQSGLAERILPLINESEEIADEVVQSVTGCGDLQDKSGFNDVDLLADDTAVLPIFADDLGGAVAATLSGDLVAAGFESQVFNYCGPDQASAVGVLAGKFTLSESRERCRELEQMLAGYGIVAKCDQRIVRYPACAMPEAEPACVDEPSEPPPGN